jgi:hypothetical protein
MRRDETEWFEYPSSWATAYRGERGSLTKFPQYALMELLRLRYGIESLTWLHLASVDRHAKRRVANGEPWLPAAPNASPDSQRTQRRAAAWKTMRQVMGPAFDVLQEAIVRARFVGAFQGEPDLFCWAGGVWFFAEAKRAGERVLPSQHRWWRIARGLRGVDCRIFTCRLVVEGTLRPSDTAHTRQWRTMIDEIQPTSSGSLGTGETFVRRVLHERRGA